MSVLHPLGKSRSHLSDRGRHTCRTASWQAIAGGPALSARLGLPAPP